jgi:hypothetical protein
MEIVTGMDVPTSPEVLKKILRHYQDTVSFHIYTRNFFHANVYIFDLPYRKSVAFVGSGHFTLEGIKDQEEFFVRVTDAKEIEGLKSWFIGYYEFAEPLSQMMVDEYDLVYPAMKQREFASREEKQNVIELTARGFHWDHIKFKNQYFKKEDYLALTNSKASLINPVVLSEREVVKDKLRQLQELMHEHASKLKLLYDATHNIGSTEPAMHADQKLREMGIANVRHVDLKKYPPGIKLRDFMTIQVLIRQKDVAVELSGGRAGEGRVDREYFQEQMKGPDFRSLFHKTLTGLGKDYWIEVYGSKRPADSFSNEEALWEFVKQDDWRYYKSRIAKVFSPGVSDISNEIIVATLSREFDQLIVLHNQMKDPR